MGERMQARDACVGARSHDALHCATHSGLKHLGDGPDWVRLGDRSEPEADRVITVSPHLKAAPRGLRQVGPCASPSASVLDKRARCYPESVRLT